MTATFNSPEFDYNLFASRHIGPNQGEIDNMLTTLGFDSLGELTASVVPKSIVKSEPLSLPGGLSEQQALNQLKILAAKNQVYKSLLGLGYHGTITPPVIQRNVLENPGWYTAYTPYQPEIAQGRLEGLLTFQQMIMDLTGLDMANASMLDEATAAAEAMAMAKRQLKKNKSLNFFIDINCHPQTIAVVKTRAEHFNFKIITGDPGIEDSANCLASEDYFGALLQNPGSNGEARDLTRVIETIHNHNAMAIIAADPMSMVLLRSPGSMGADIVIGSNQRFGIAPGFGGPHAGFFAFRSDYKRSAPGRIIGVSVDQRGKPALRMAMQTREQHIRREKANSNICTAQVLLALMSAFYAMYHGPKGLRQIAFKIHQLANELASGLLSGGYQLRYQTWFDTLTIETPGCQKEILSSAEQLRINLRPIDDNAVAISLDETCDSVLLKKLLTIFGNTTEIVPTDDINHSQNGLPEHLLRKDNILLHPIFNSYHSETEMLRYLKRMENRDISLTNSMIPLGSCTMKLNSTAEMMPVTWPEFSQIHPFAPAEQARGYHQLISELEEMLVKCTGYAAVSMQPNAGSQGEYAGLIAIKKFHQSLGEGQRDICLIPSSAHGTNPATAHMVGMKVVVVKCDEDGNIDSDDLNQQVLKSGNRLAALMVTYPSTHGVFEIDIVAICKLIHDNGGQVYIDGANLNALVGIADPGKFGGDVSHINLHKTFCIPHGGGGPGMGPIAVAEHLVPFLPGHPLAPQISATGESNTISAAPWGSPSILPISWMYIKMMGGPGLTRASQIAILNANYLAEKLQAHYPVLYTGQNNHVAHECIIDIRPLKATTGITEEDIAKRLMDYGYHAPTMSFPVPGTLMIEPTESESKVELDRFVKAMIMIRNEIARVESGEWDEKNNPLKQAPHTLTDILDEQWSRPYSRELAARPTPWQQEHKVWPTVNRIDNVYGDRNLVCSCPPIAVYEE